MYKLYLYGKTAYLPCHDPEFRIFPGFYPYQDFSPYQDIRSYQDFQSHQNIQQYQDFSPHRDIRPYQDFRSHRNIKPFRAQSVLQQVPLHYTIRQEANAFSFASGDVNGDGVADNVFLTGYMTPDSQFVRDITLVIQDGRTGRFYETALKENAGYDPALFLGDFTVDGVSDILVSINSGGSGAFMYHYVYSNLNNQLRLLFNFEDYNSKYRYTVNYLDGYLVEVVSINNNTRYLIDISQKGSEYLNEIYNSDGTLKAPISGFVNPLSVLQPVDLDYDRVLELMAWQKIAGRYNADSLGYVQNILKWGGQSFELTDQMVAIFGSDRQ